jgi:hypothetical protein
MWVASAQVLASLPRPLYRDEPPKQEFTDRVGKPGGGIAGATVVVAFTVGAAVAGTAAARDAVTVYAGVAAAGDAVVLLSFGRITVLFFTVGFLPVSQRHDCRH